MYCPKCGTPNEATAEKCKFCATLLPKVSATGEPIQVNSNPNPTTPPPNPAYQPGQPGSQYNYVPPPTPGYNPASGYSYGGPSGYYAAPHAGYYPTPSTVGYAPLEAGFWVRFGAWFLDYIITGVVSTIVFLIPASLWFANFISKYSDRITPVCDPDSVRYSETACNRVLEQIFTNEAELGSFIGIFFGLGLLVLLLNLLYHVLFTAQGATLGKKAFGIKVVMADGSAPGFWRALLRETLGKIASGAFLNIGYLWAAFDDRKQAWHDKIANTYVIRSR